MIKINKGITFSYKKKPIIIAEISGNHNGNKKKFLSLVKSAFANGADLVKIQTYEPKDITLNIKNKKFKIKEGIWKNQYLWDLYKKASTPFNWHAEAFKIAKKYDKILFSSPFSIRAVNFLENFNVPLYKISSFEITDHKLIKYISSKNKPIILSTGMASLKEIQDAIKIINGFHNKVIILHCVSGYPTKLKDTNIGRINLLKKKFKKNLIGISDHTNSLISTIASIPLGIVAIEKHYKLDDKISTADSEFSIVPRDLKQIRKIVDDLDVSLNHKKKESVEATSKKLRRSIFAIKNIKKGEIFNHNNIDTLRPSIGLSASKYFFVIGKKAKINIKTGMPIKKNYLQ
ncbi:pseudaminic acid synthase [Candidatus Pelagibacter sp.]|nr:pseudaminic acid synthase [Candidatus Pelagibacter sp.]